MDLIFSNPAGFWALLGIPVILAIHFLQRQSKEVTITTLFLLQQMLRESTEGRQIDRIRSSVPLWLQLLMVLLLTWLLTQPRWLREDSVQPVAVVLDESASMTAFQKEAREALVKALQELSASVARTEYYMVGSGLSDRNLYRGTDLNELEAALGRWEPSLGQHDFTPALRVARNAVGPRGIVLLLTDHPQAKLPFDAHVLAAGRPIANVGFTGLEIREDDAGQPRWRALIRNYSDETASRDWSLISGTQRSPAQTLELRPGEIRALEGGFPEGIRHARLQLSPDAFAPDDVLPLLRPEPRPLFFRASVSPRLEELVLKAMGSIQYAHPAQTGEGAPPPDLVVAGYDPLKPALPEETAIVFLDRADQWAKPAAGRLVAENHPLTEHLNWQPLILRQSIGIPLTPADTVLLWREDKPLILLRDTGAFRQLLFGFDLATSNADKLPAFILLLHRFAESIRAEKPVLERTVLETGQPLRIPLPESNPDTPARFRFLSWNEQNDWDREVPLDQLERETAPRHPGFLEVLHAGEPLLEATTFFADTREADFREAARVNQLADLTTVLVERHTETDTNWTLWILLLLALLIGSWSWMSWRQSQVEGEARTAAATSP